MTLLPDDELKAVRDDDASWSDGYVAAEIANGGGLIAQRRALLRHIDALQEQLDAARKDAERYRFWRQHQYNGLLDVDEYCDENSPQAVHFDRLTDAAIDAAKEPTPLPGEGE